MLTDVVRVVGHHHGNAQLFPQPGQFLVNGRQLLDVLVPLQLQEVIFAKQLPVLQYLAPGFIRPSVGNQPGHLRRGAARQANQALVVLIQQFPVNSRAVVEALQVGLGNQLHQVAVAYVVLGQQHQVVGTAFGGVAVVAAAVGNVNLAADDGLDACFLALGVEVHHTVKVAVVRDGQGLHSHVADLVHQVGNAADAIEHAVFGVGVQVGEQRARASAGRGVKVGTN